MYNHELLPQGMPRINWPSSWHECIVMDNPPLVHDGCQPTNQVQAMWHHHGPVTVIHKYPTWLTINTYRVTAWRCDACYVHDWALWAVNMLSKQHMHAYYMSVHVSPYAYVGEGLHVDRAYTNAILTPQERHACVLIQASTTENTTEKLANNAVF